MTGNITDPDPVLFITVKETMELLLCHFLNSFLMCSIHKTAAAKHFSVPLPSCVFSFPAIGKIQRQ
jgi:hypothetical protein